MASVTSIAAPGPAAANTAASKAGGIIDIGDPTKMPDHDVSFSDVLSVLNPLQYIPIVGSIYRAVTGDTIPQAAQVLGGALLGGPLGLVASAANAVLEQSTGKDAEQHLAALFVPQDDAPPASPQNKRYAAATPASPASEAGATAEPAPAPTAASASLPAASAAIAAAPAAATPLAEPTTTNAPTSQPAAVPLPRPPAGALPPTAAASPAMAMAGPGGAGRPAGSGYTLADYRTFAGTGVPPPPNGNAQRTAFVPLQTTLPLPNDVTRAPVVAAAVHPPETVAPAPAATATASTQPQDTWISQAMMRGLDRYRDMMRQQDQQQGQKQDPQPGS
jgi:hypothetical protein